MRPEMITQIIWKQLFCVIDVRVIGKLILRQLMRVIGVLPYEGAKLHKKNHARKPCVCNRFGPHSKSCNCNCI